MMGGKTSDLPPTKSMRKLVFVLIGLERPVLPAYRTGSKKARGGSVTSEPGEDGTYLFQFGSEVNSSTGASDGVVLRETLRALSLFGPYSSEKQFEKVVCSPSCKGLFQTASEE
jgi:hypothetical protein